MFRLIRGVVAIIRFKRALVCSGGDFVRFWRSMVKFRGSEKAAAERLVFLLERYGRDYASVLADAFIWGEDHEYWLKIKKNLEGKGADKK